jgi:hypothetical protein
MGNRLGGRATKKSVDERAFFADFASWRLCVRRKPRKKRVRGNLRTMCAPGAHGLESIFSDRPRFVTLTVRSEDALRPPTHRAFSRRCRVFTW